MKYLTFLYFFLISYSGFSQKIITPGQPHGNIKIVLPYYFGNNKLKLSIIYEGNVNIDGKNIKGYTIEWQDTIGSKNNYLSYNRPKEIHCVIRDSKGIVGEYTGSSTQFTHCNFFTNEKSVKIFFYIGQNKFYYKENKSKSEELIKQNSISDDSSEQIKVTIQKTIPREIELFSSSSRLREEYKPLKVNLNDIELNYINGYNNKEVVLQPNKNIVVIDYISKRGMNPNNMPRLGPNYCNILVLNRFLINENNGKIKKGKFWIKLRGVKKCCDISFRVIDPDIFYSRIDGKKILGKKIIQKRKVNLNKFEINQFMNIGKDSKPY